MSQQRSRRERRPDDEPVCAGLYRALRASPEEQKAGDQPHEPNQKRKARAPDADRTKTVQGRKRRARTRTRQTDGG